MWCKKEERKKKAAKKWWGGRVVIIPVHPQHWPIGTLLQGRDRINVVSLLLVQSANLPPFQHSTNNIYIQIRKTCQTECAKLHEPNKWRRFLPKPAASIHLHSKMHFFAHLVLHANNQAQSFTFWKFLKEWRCIIWTNRNQVQVMSVGHQPTFKNVPASSTSKLKYSGFRHTPWPCNANYCHSWQLWAVNQDFSSCCFLFFGES